MSGDDVHEVYAIKYGRHERRAAENYIGGDPHDVPEPIDFYVWAITGPQGTFVVDTDPGDKVHPHFYCDGQTLVALHRGFEILDLRDREQSPGAYHWEFTMERGA